MFAMRPKKDDRRATCITRTGPGNCRNCGQHTNVQHLEVFGSRGALCGNCCTVCNAKSTATARRPAPSPPAAALAAPKSGASQWRSLGFGVPRMKDGLLRDAFYTDTPMDKAMRSAGRRDQGWIPRRDNWFPRRRW